MTGGVVRNAMSDDLEFVHAKIPSYRGYDDEADRHDSDMRIRAYVGGALTDVQTLIGDSLDAPTRTALEEVLFRCMFTDQVFIRNFEHRDLPPPLVAALVRSDRTLIELADRARTAAAAELAPVLQAIDADFEYRRAPEPVS